MTGKGHGQWGQRADCLEETVPAANPEVGERYVSLSCAYETEWEVDGLLASGRSSALTILTTADHVYP